MFVGDKYIYTYCLPDTRRPGMSACRFVPFLRCPKTDNPSCLFRYMSTHMSTRCCITQIVSRWLYHADGITPTCVDCITLIVSLWLYHTDCITLIVSRWLYQDDCITLIVSSWLYHADDITPIASRRLYVLWPISGWMQDQATTSCRSSSSSSDLK
jgi:hypothetical protein